jgi:hypothetical protein
MEGSRGSGHHEGVVAAVIRHKSSGVSGDPVSRSGREVKE